MLEGTTLGEAHTGALMMSITGNVVIYVGIRRFEPICEVLELIPCTVSVLSVLRRVEV